MAKDIKIKRAQYIQKNCEILQEFSFAHPMTILKVYQIFNSHFYGSPLFDLFSRECNMLEKSYNVSVRRMFDIPRESSSYFIESLTECPHLRSVLVKRFLKFVDKLNGSEKTRKMLNLIKHDVRSVTGRNLRNIMDLVNTDSIDSLTSSDAELSTKRPQRTVIGKLAL